VLILGHRIAVALKAIISHREISPTALPRRFANCRPSPELLKSWTPKLISGLVIIAMLERKYSGAEQLIVKLQKECQTLKRETDDKPSLHDQTIQFEEDRFGIEL
jgi:hypothetical protein